MAAAVVFAIASAITLYFVATMSGAMAMPCGWMMSMMWMAMPGQGTLAIEMLFTDWLTPGFVRQRTYAMAHCLY